MTDDQTTRTLDAYTGPAPDVRLGRLVEDWLDGDDLAATLGAVDLALEQAAGIDDVRSPETYQRAVEAIQALGAAITGAERRYRGVLDPLREAQRRITLHRTGALGSPRAADQSLRRQAGEWLQRRSTERAEAAAAAAAAAEASRAAREAVTPDAVPGIADAGTAAAASAPIPVPASTPARIEDPPVPAARQRTTWRAEVHDREALIRAVAAGEVPSDVLSVNRSALGRHARSLRDSMHWPGVRVWADQSVAVRRTR